MVEFLRQEAAAFDEVEVREEIERLKLDDVCLFWPDRPDGGMIYFAGPSDERLWRCDYLGGTFQNLGFDS